MAGEITFTVNGRTHQRRSRRDHPPGLPAPRHRHPPPLLPGGPAPRRQLPGLRGGDRGRAASRPLLQPPAGGGDGGAHRQRAGEAGAEDGSGAASGQRAAAKRHPAQRAAPLVRGPRRGNAPLRPAPAAASPPPPSGDERQPCGLHPLHPLRARLPRGQVNDVIGYAYRGERSQIVFDLDDDMGESSCVACGECVQACPTGALMPAGGVGLEVRRPPGRHRLPLLRGRLSAALPRQGKPHPLRRGAARPGQQGAALRQGALRLRLRPPPPAPDQAPDPPRRRPQDPRARFRPGEPGHDLPRGELGGGPRCGRRRPEEESSTSTARRGWPASARPRAPTRRPTSSRSWCGSGSAATTSTTAPASATPPRWPP